MFVEKNRKMDDFATENISPDLYFLYSLTAYVFCLFFFWKPNFFLKNVSELFT